MEYTCGKCRQVFTVGEEMRGQVYTCANCGARMKIPGQPPAPEGDALERLAQASQQARPPGAVPPPQTSPYDARAPYGVQAPYGAQVPYYQPVQPNAPGAVPSMVLGIVGMVSCLGSGCCIAFTFAGAALGCIAVILATQARRHIRLSPGRYGGKGMATAGLTLGIISLILGVIGGVASILMGITYWGQMRRGL